MIKVTVFFLISLNSLEKSVLIKKKKTRYAVSRYAVTPLRGLLTTWNGQQKTCNCLATWPQNELNSDRCWPFYRILTDSNFKW